MKHEVEKISKRMIYSPFLLMLGMVAIISISNIVYNYLEYTQSIGFIEQEYQAFVAKGVANAVAEENLYNQRQHLIETVQGRIWYGFGATFFAIFVVGIYTYFIFRKMIYRAVAMQKELVSEKEKLEVASLELRRVNELIGQQLYIDTLTNLGNRHALERDIALMKEPKLILLDIDSFKDINEFYGARVGDFILSQVAEQLRMFAKEYKVEAYRTGADEFAILEEAPLDVEHYEELASTLVMRFKGNMVEVPFLDESVEINIAIGFCLESEDIFKKATLALEEAKKKEIDYLCYFRKIERTTRYADQVKWSSFIKEALKNDTVKPYYQPIFDSQKRLVKYECLARILNSKEEAIPPGLFLSISKKVKKYTALSKILIDKSFKEIVKTDKLISINVLARDMSDSDISNYVVEKLREYNVAKQVVFEILEDESIENIERVGVFIDRVKRMGCQIAIDDFGTGYSNFSYLLKLKPDYIKIDGSLIKHLDTDRNSLAIVSAIITFARRLDIKTIAEYVHSEQIFNICLELGIDEFQGFYLGEPSAKLI